MLPDPNGPSTMLLDEDGFDEPRFAAQRAVAAQIDNLPERMLLHRARSVGEAHRRSESAQLEAIKLD